MRVKSWLGGVVLGAIVLSLPSIAVACGGGSSSSGSGSSPAGMSSSETFTRLNWASLDSNADAHKGATRTPNGTRSSPSQTRTSRSTTRTTFTSPGR